MRLGLLMSMCLVGVPALADDEPEAPEADATTSSDGPSRLRLRTRPRSKQHGLALTMSGALAAQLIVEGTGDFNLPGQHSVALVLGAGAPQSFGVGVIQQLVVHAGAQYRYTVLGDFDTGLYVGLEALWQIQPVLQGTPWQAPITPMAGFRYTAPFGLVAEVGGGPSLVVSNFRPVRAGAQFNLQVGWAFGDKPWR